MSPFSCCSKIYLFNIFFHLIWCLFITDFHCSSVSSRQDNIHSFFTSVCWQLNRVDFSWACRFVHTCRLPGMGAVADDTSQVSHFCALPCFHSLEYLIEKKSSSWPTQERNPSCLVTPLASALASALPSLTDQISDQRRSVCFILEYALHYNTCKPCLN